MARVTRGLWRFVRARGTVLGYLVLVAALIVVNYRQERTARDLERVAVQTHDSLCSFKHDIGRRYDATAEFIAEIKAGIRPPITGISVADLNRSLDNLKLTLDSLNGLDCR